MEFRQIDLKGSLEALNLGHVPLVKAAGKSFAPAGYGDDLGCYYFIPLLAKTFDLPLADAVNMFYGFLTLAGLSAALLGFSFLFRSWYARAAAAVLLIWFESSTRVWDVYVLQFFTVFTVIPLFLCFYRRQGPAWIWAVFLMGGGLICGYANMIRAHSGTGVVLFLLMFIGLNPGYPVKRKAWGSILLLLFFLLPHFHFRLLEKKRDEFLGRTTYGTQLNAARHPFWHVIYIGLGYAPNKHGLEYNDWVAYNKVKSIDPKAEWFSAEYDAVLKKQVFSLVRSDPFFILRNIGMKTQQLLGYLLKFAGIGLVLAFFLRPSWRFVVPFILLALFDSAPSLFAIPTVSYAVGLIAAAVVFQMVMIGMAIDRYEGSAKRGRA